MIMYHGTTKENSDQIIQEGFNTGTYFTELMETALVQGGDYIFVVYFESRPTAYWEYISNEHIPPDRIIRLYAMNPTIPYENKRTERLWLRDSVREYAMEMDLPEPIFCEHCDGRGQIEDYPWLTRNRSRLEITPCPRCEGFGVINWRNL